jgi:hypothetical protein
MNRRSALKSNVDYRQLDQYYGLIPGTVGTVRGVDGSLRSPAIPAFAPSMAVQTVPNYSKPSYIGTPSDLQHGLPASDLSRGHFSVENAYSGECTTFQKRSCDGNVAQDTIPLPDRVDDSDHLRHS